MISEIRPLIAGAALQLALQPPAGALLWRVLRKGDNSISSEVDTDAVKVYEGVDRLFVDVQPGLVNEVPCFYRPFYLVGGVWEAGDTVSGTPRLGFEGNECDAQHLVRDRIEEGFKAEVARNALKPEVGHVSVYTAPPAQTQTDMPVVIVHLEGDATGERGLGEFVTPDTRDEQANEWVEHEGMLDNVSLEIQIWSLNPDERVLMRKLLQRILVANLGIFDAAGLIEIAWNARDLEFLNGEFGANVYQTVFSFTCQAPVFVTSRAPTIASTTTTVVVDVEAPVQP